MTAEASEGMTLQPDGVDLLFIQVKGRMSAREAGEGHLPTGFLGHGCCQRTTPRLAAAGAGACGQLTELKSIGADEIAHSVEPLRVHDLSACHALLSSRGEQDAHGAMGEGLLEQPQRSGERQ